MGEFIREFMDRRRPPESSRLPPKVALLVVVVGVFAVGFLIAAVVRLSVVAVIGSLVFAVAGLTWWLSDQARDRPQSRAGRIFRTQGEVKFAAISLICLLVGFFGWLLGMIKGW